MIKSKDLKKKSKAPKKKSRPPRESKLTISIVPGKKTIEIDIERQNKITVEREDGRPPKVTGHEYGPIDTLVIDGQEIPNVFPDDTVIFTHHSPGCGYYYFNGKWWYK